MVKMESVESVLSIVSGGKLANGEEEAALD